MEKNYVSRLLPCIVLAMSLKTHSLEGLSWFKSKPAASFESKDILPAILTHDLKKLKEGLTLRPDLIKVAYPCALEFGSYFAIDQIVSLDPSIVKTTHINGKSLFLLVLFGKRPDEKDLADVESPDDQMRALHLLETIDLDILKYLIDKGMPLNNTDEKGNTALYEAFTNKKFDFFCLLLEKGASVDVPCLNEMGDTLLHEVAKNEGTPEHASELLVAKWVNQGKSLDMLDTTSLTALHCAIDHRHSSFVRALRKHAFDTNTTDKEGLTVLCKAVKTLQPEVCKLLIEKKADCKKIGERGQTLIHLVAQSAYVPGPGTSTIRSSVYGYFRFSGAASSRFAADYLYMSPESLKQREIIELLVSRGAMFDGVDSEGKTPLHYAAKLRNLAVCCSLIDCGANVGAQDNEGNSPLHLLFNNIKTAQDLYHASLIYQFFVSKNVSRKLVNKKKEIFLHTFFYTASPDLDLSVFNEAESNWSTYIDINAQDVSGMAPLMIALERRFKENSLLTYLKHYFKVRQSIILSPATHAIINTFKSFEPPKMHEGLLAQATDSPNNFMETSNSQRTPGEILLPPLENLSRSIRDYKRGYTLLFFAADAEYQQICEYLIKCGFSLSHTDKFKSSLLHTVCLKKNIPLLAFFVNFCKSNVFDKDGNTPLHFASQIGFTDGVRMLLDCPYGEKADPTIKNSSGNTPLSFAIDNNYFDIVNILLCYGAQADEQNLIAAVQKGHVDICKVIVESTPKRIIQKLRSQLIALSGGNKDLIDLFSLYSKLPVNNDDDDTTGTVSQKVYSVTPYAESLPNQQNRPHLRTSETGSDLNLEGMLDSAIQEDDYETEIHDDAVSNVS